MDEPQTCSCGGDGLHWVTCPVGGINAPAWPPAPPDPDDRCDDWFIRRFTDLPIDPRSEATRG